MSAPPTITHHFISVRKQHREDNQLSAFAARQLTVSVKLEAERGDDWLPEGNIGCQRLPKLFRV